MILGPQSILWPSAATAGTTNGNFTQPAVGASVNVTFTSTKFLTQNESVYIWDGTYGGYYTVANIISSTHAVVVNTGASGSSAAGATVSSGAAVTPTAPTANTPYMDISITANSLPVDAMTAYALDVLFQLVGSSPVGTLFVQASNNPNTAYSNSGQFSGWTNGAPPDNDASWTAVPATLDGVFAAGGSFSISGQANHSLQIQGPWKWIKIGWTKTSGSGNLSAKYLGIGPS